MNKKNAGRSNLNEVLHYTLLSAAAAAALDLKSILLRLSAAVSGVSLCPLSFAGRDLVVTYGYVLGK